MYLPGYVKNALDILSSRGYYAYVVGGCVRDFLLGHSPDDYDITTSALPEQIIEAFEGFRLLTVGLKHGTVTVITEEGNIEITTFRTDGEYTDHRHPEKVTFTGELKDDLSRRDFTVNAMAYHPNTGIIDLFGGREDLKAGIIRAVGDPFKRFDEDGLRIMRALRFASKLDFTLEENTARAVHELKHLLSDIANERIRDEINGFLLGNCRQLLTDYSDVICTIIPEMTDCVGFEQHSKYHDKTVYEHIASTVAAADKELIYKVTMLLHDIGKPAVYFNENGTGHFYGHAKVSVEIARVVLERLRYPKKFISYVLFLIENHGISINDTEKCIRKALLRYGEKEFFDLIKIHIYDTKGKNPAYMCECELFENITKATQELIDEMGCFSLKDLAVKGDDLTEIGYKGEDVGQALSFLLKSVAERRCENDRDRLLAYLKKCDPRKGDK